MHTHKMNQLYEQSETDSDTQYDSEPQYDSDTQYDYEPQHEDIIIYRNTYKLYRGHKYVLTFPDEWILNEMAHTGRQCPNCVNVNAEGIADGFGMWRGVIIGYCMNCAEHSYRYSRGYGFQGQAVENIPVVVEIFTAAWYTYLAQIDLNSVGNIEMNPEDTIENYIDLCEIQEQNAYLEYMNQDDGYDSSF